MGKRYPRVPGIYKIEFIATGEIYIGSSNKLGRRITEHKNDLRKGRHYSKRLQELWNEHGEDGFTFSVVEYCDLSVIHEREQHYMDTLLPEFNACPSANSPRGYVRSPESVGKMRQGSIRYHAKHEYKGKLYTASQLADMCDVRYSTLKARLNRGIPVEEAMNVPTAPNEYDYFYRGVRHSTESFADLLGVSVYRITFLKRKGLSDLEIASTIHASFKKTSLEELGRLFGIKGDVVRKRVSKGMSVMRALTAPREPGIPVRNRIIGEV